MTEPESPSQPHQQQPARQPARVRSLLIGLLAGVLVTALVVGTLGLAGVVHWGESAAVGTRSVELPNTLAGMTDLAQAAAKKDTQGGGQAIKQRQDRTYARTVDRYRTAFGGAATGVRTYTTADLDSIFTVVAVRADSPGLVNGPAPDPADLGLAAGGNLFELGVEGGDTQCLYTSSEPVKAGQPVDAKDRLTTVCRAVSAGLTVYVFGAGRGSGGNQQMARLARAARVSIAGS